MRKEANGSAIEKSQTKINLCYIHISDDVCEKNIPLVILAPNSFQYL